MPDMKTVVYSILLVLLLVGAGWQAFRVASNKLDTRIAKFNKDAEDLIQGLQQFKEFVGAYPLGNNQDVVKSLLGQSDKKVLILAIRKSDINSKGEVVDPWGTPMKFYISGDSLLIRSAGPNKAWEDSTIMTSDDLFRSNN
jgi:hypothetical protein